MIKRYLKNIKDQYEKKDFIDAVDYIEKRGEIKEKQVHGSFNDFFHLYKDEFELPSTTSYRLASRSIAQEKDKVWFKMKRDREKVIHERSEDLDEDHIIDGKEFSKLALSPFFTMDHKTGKCFMNGKCIGVKERT